MMIYDIYIYNYTCLYIIYIYHVKNAFDERMAEDRKRLLHIRTMGLSSSDYYIIFKFKYNKRYTGQNKFIENKFQLSN